MFKKNDASSRQPVDKEQVSFFDQDSDETLIHAIAGGSIGAMEILYQRYHRPLYSLAYHIVADHQVAEDLLQEAFLSVWRRAATYSPQSGEVHSWLFSIIHHRAIDHLRAVQRRASLKKLSLEEADLDEHAFSPDVWDEAWLSVKRSQVREALMGLRKEQRMVIELVYFQGWTHTEVAEGCQIPLGTVKARIRLGLLHLKRLLEQKGIHPDE